VGACAAAPAAQENDPCPSVRGTLDDWFQMLNRGIRRTALGNSDSHSVYDVEAGVPRNYVASPAEVPQAIRIEDIVRSVKAGRTFATYGPFVEVTLSGQPIGSVVPVAAGDEVELRVRVKSPRWIEVDRLEIYRNGDLWQVVEGRPDCDPDDPSCLRVPTDEVVKYDGRFPDRPERDSWYVVVAMGLRGKTLAPVYSSTPVARLGTFELIQRLAPLLPPLRSLGIPFSPTISEVRPFAVTNPVWADVDGDGLTPIDPLPSWATPRDQAQALQTPSAAGDPHAKRRAPRGVGAAAPPASKHDHRFGLGRMRGDARAFLDFLYQGPLTAARLQEAMSRFGVGR
jgi:hypothetical protein